MHEACALAGDLAPGLLGFGLPVLRCHAHLALWRLRLLLVLVLVITRGELAELDKAGALPGDLAGLWILLLFLPLRRLRGLLERHVAARRLLRALLLLLVVLVVRGRQLSHMHEARALPGDLAAALVAVALGLRPVRGCILEAHLGLLVASLPGCGFRMGKSQEVVGHSFRSRWSLLRVRAQQMAEEFQDVVGAFDAGERLNHRPRPRKLLGSAVRCNGRLFGLYRLELLAGARCDWPQDMALRGEKQLAIRVPFDQALRQRAQEIHHRKKRRIRASDDVTDALLNDGLAQRDRQLPDIHLLCH
mmetsp:Transcript_6446/g.17946  ORF Transcript_6446/g.17946 Transcript_6446/m.17946 type:complete len:304 (+) Transcript_6446:1-912(+)